jgi:hypothetical protein
MSTQEIGKYYVIVHTYPKNERYLLGQLWIRETCKIEGVISRRASDFPFFVVIDTFKLGDDAPVMIELGDDPRSSESIVAFCSNATDATTMRFVKTLAAEALSDV